MSHQARNENNISIVFLLEVNKQKKKKNPFRRCNKRIVLEKNISNLPFPSVKSLIPPPTVNGTKTFSDVYRNICISYYLHGCKLRNKLKLEFLKESTVYLDEAGKIICTKRMNSDVLIKPAALVDLPEESLGSPLYSKN